jgi:hypothetical protein
MIETTVEAVDEGLRLELARGDAVLASAQPILRHLLANDDRALFSDGTVASIRGMILDIATQLLIAEAEAARSKDPAGFVTEHQDDLTASLIKDDALLAHTHALTLEAQLIERLRDRSGIDPVLSPLMQELLADPDPDVAATAMALLAAQARFMQQSRRMELPLAELPGELFHRALLAFGDREAGDSEVRVVAAAKLRDSFVERDGRLGLLTRIVTAPGSKANRALAIEHAGLSIFATVLSFASDQRRATTVLTMADLRVARFALALRVAGLQQRDLEEQFLLLHPDAPLPPGVDPMSADRAAELLAASDPRRPI